MRQGEVDAAWITDGLMYTLRALATPADVLTGSYPPFVCVKCELLQQFATFRDAFCRARAETISPEQLSGLANVDECLAPLGGVGLCSDVPLEAEGWSRVRSEAARVLGLFSWQYAVPPVCVEVSPGHWRQSATGSSWVKG